MDVDVSKENVCINKLVIEKREFIFAEEDMIVPDSKPDILNTINITGNVCVYKKEVTDGRVKIEGCVNTYIMYLPDSQNDTIRGLNASVNFSHIMQVPEAKDGMTAICKVNIKDLECKVLNGRKISVKAGLEINVRLYSNENIEIINKVNNIKSIQTLEKDFQINSLIGNNSTKVYVKDTLSIDEKDEILEILKTDINLINDDVKISYNKILSKCEVEVRIMYLTQDGRINSVQGKIPAVGFIDMQNVTEENICDIETEVKNILVRANSADEHSIYVEVELETLCMCYEKKNIMTIEDLYSPVMDLGFSQKKINMTSERVVKTKDFTVTNKINISDLNEGHLIDVEINSVINKQEITNSKILYEGEIALNFIFENNKHSVNSKISKIPFEFSMDNPIGIQNISVETRNIILDKKFDVRSGGDVECSIDMECIGGLSKNLCIDIIDDIKIEENRAEREDYDSLIMYIVMPGDTLWKIAKKFKSTVQDIAITNGIEDTDKIEIGQKLYIPKFNYSKE